MSSPTFSPEVLDSVRRTAIRLVQRARETRQEMRVAAKRRMEEERLRRKRREQRWGEAERVRIERKRAELLLGKVSDWVQADQLRRFAAAYRQAADQRSDENTNPRDAEWLRWIDAIVVRLDPLTHGLAAWGRAATEASSLAIRNP